MTSYLLNATPGLSSFLKILCMDSGLPFVFCALLVCCNWCCYFKMKPARWILTPCHVVPNVVRFAYLSVTQVWVDLWMAFFPPSLPCLRPSHTRRVQRISIVPFAKRPCTWRMNWTTTSTISYQKVSVQCPGSITRILWRFRVTLDHAYHQSLRCKLQPLPCSVYFESVKFAPTHLILNW